VALDLSGLTDPQLFARLEHGERMPLPAKGLLLHDLVAAQAAATPDLPAVVAPDGQLTYRELEDRASRLAAHLQGYGVGPDVLVGICLERSCQFVVALYASLKAGGAYLPLDPEQPLTRLAGILEEAVPAVVITESRLLERLPESAIPQVIIEGADQLSQGRERVAESPVTARNLAYVIYTSGSTGRPKGVMIEHRSITNHLLWRARWLRLGSQDRVLQKAPMGFDVSVWEIFCPLISGAATVMLEPSGQRDPRAIGLAIRRSAATMVSFTPSMLRLFLEEGEAERCRSLREVVVGGEALSGALAAEAHRRFGPAVRFSNLYGPTETTVVSAFWPYQDGEDPVPIGRPVANTQICVLDSDMRRVPIGEGGEIFIGGVGLARGYLRHPELTEQQFVPHPFNDGELLYRTGDMGSWRSDGALLFGGRRDGQVKVRGNRVELAEIELALLHRAGLAQAKVMVRRDALGDSSLVAYVVPSRDHGASPTASAMRTALRDALPQYMIPSEFVVVDALPINSSGKAVLTIEGEAAEGAGGPTPPPPSCLYLIASTAQAASALEGFARSLQLNPDAVVVPPPLSSLSGAGDEIVAHEVFATIRALQPRGPYLLAGYGKGGFVAYQVATAMAAAGAKMAWLGLYEAPYPGLRLRSSVWRHRTRRGSDIRRERAAHAVDGRVLPGYAGSNAVGDPDPPSATMISAEHQGILQPAEGNQVPLELFASRDLFRATGTPTLGWEKLHQGRITPHEMGGLDLLSSSDEGAAEAVELTRRSLRRAGLLA
jgi:amino acid adenylation domain-containing protein